MKRPERIIRGQRVDPKKLALAKQLRRAMTPQEARLWSSLRRNGLNGFHFRRQQVVDGFVLDFYCHQAALAVEIDGPIHQHQPEYDAERSRWLGVRGLRVIRFSNDELDANFDGVLARISAACHKQFARQS